MCRFLGYIPPFRKYIANMNDQNAVLFLSIFYDSSSSSSEIMSLLCTFAIYLRKGGIYPKNRHISRVELFLSLIFRSVKVIKQAFVSGSVTFTKRWTMDDGRSSLTKLLAETNALLSYTSRILTFTICTE
jgi:hypothetical protein